MASSALSNAVRNCSATRPSCISHEHGKTIHFNQLNSSCLGHCLWGARFMKIFRRHSHRESHFKTWTLDRRTKQFGAVVAWIPSEERVACSGTSGEILASDVCNEARRMRDASIDSTTVNTDIVLALHETARMCQVALEKQKSLTKGPWFTKAWLGIDHNAWIKSVSYQHTEQGFEFHVHDLASSTQAAVYALIKATLDIVTRTEGGSLNTISIIQQSILRLSDPLEKSIQQQLLSRDDSAGTWFWYEQQPIAVKKLADVLERCLLSVRAIAHSQDSTPISWNLSDEVLLKLVLNVLSSITKVGLGKLSCHIFSVSLLEEIEHLMEALLDCSSIEDVYSFTSNISLRTHYLKHFGRQAAQTSSDENERAFWIELVSSLLRGAMAREGVLSKLSSSAHFEMLKQDLAVFSFFAALARRARSLLAARNICLDNTFIDFFRYLEGGIVMHYPQMGSLTTYQLFVEVASEELMWIPFFEETIKDLKDLPHNEGEVLAAILNVCSYWVDDFMLYDGWVIEAESPAVRIFLSNIQLHLYDCVAATSQKYRPKASSRIMKSRAAVEVEQALNYLLQEDLTYRVIGEKARGFLKTWKSGGIKERLIASDLKATEWKEQLEAFDKDLKTVEEVLVKLEDLLKQSKLLKVRNGSVHLTAIQISLQKLRRLKKEAEDLKSKLLQSYGQNSQDDVTQTDIMVDADGIPSQERLRKPTAVQRTKSFVQTLAKTIAPSKVAPNDDIASDVSATCNVVIGRSNEAVVLKELAKLGDLQRELFELDLRIRACTEETLDGNDDYTALCHAHQTSEEGSKMWEFLSNSTIKFKNATLDVLKGTQLLATDVSIAVSLLQSSLSGHSLTDREKKVLKRTCTDLASVIPIGFLMLLPVTAVGHAAILAAIQKYVPALIPSAYAPERLHLLKQLEHLKMMSTRAEHATNNVQHQKVEYGERLTES